MTKRVLMRFEPRHHSSGPEAEFVEWIRRGESEFGDGSGRDEIVCGLEHHRRKCPDDEPWKETRQWAPRCPFRDGDETADGDGPDGRVVGTQEKDEAQ